MNDKTSTLVHRIEIPGQFPVELHKDSGKRYTVVYGAQFNSGLTYGSAAMALGSAVLHALACNGELHDHT